MPWPRWAYISTASTVCGSRFHLNHGPFGRPGSIDRVPALQHHALDHRVRRRGAQSAPSSSSVGDRCSSGERSMRPDSERADERLQPLPPLAEGQGADVLAAVDQDSRRRAGRPGGWQAASPSRSCGSAAAAGRRRCARRSRRVRMADQQLAVERRLEVEPGDDVGKACARCRRRCAYRAARRRPRRTACTRMPSHFHSAA